jgi:release factor glutamine methyltransferase
LIPSRSTIQEALLQAYQALNGVSDKTESAAQLLLANVLDRSRTWIMTHPEYELDTQKKSDFLASLNRYRSGEPIPYILGWWEFYGRRFNLNDSVLIPRPETEHIVEHALRFLLAYPRKRLALDIGTGSGCIAVTLLCEIEDLHVLGFDISHKALKVAKENAVKFGVGSRFLPALMDLVGAIRTRFDLVCANLPYISSSDLENLKVAKSEPLIALNGGEDGLYFIRRLLKEIPRLLLPGGCALLELEAGTSGRVLNLAETLIDKADFKLIQDLAGHDRVLAIEY